MVIELSVGGLLTLLGIPTAITSLGLWLLQRRISKREAVQDAREAAREQNEVLLIQNTRAALALAEATAVAVQRIPDAHCPPCGCFSLPCWAWWKSSGGTGEEGMKNRHLKKAALGPCDHFRPAVRGHYRHQLPGL